MAEMRECEFFLLRYVPDAVKDEFVNIGVVLLDGCEGYADLRFTRDWSRVKCIDPAADVEMLEALERDLRSEISSGGEQREAILKRISESFSNLVQLSGTKGCLTASPQAEIEQLAKIYLESARRDKRVRDLGQRSRIAAQMRQAFEREGVWDSGTMWKKVEVKEFSRDGDPLKIDCGYKPNGVVRLFHALSLETDIDSAKVLAFSQEKLREGILREHHAKTELTAVLAETLPEDEPEIQFAVRTLTENEIKIARTSDLPAIAERARIELRL